MGNIALLICIIFIFVILYACFAVIPFAGLRGRVFGVDIENSKKFRFIKIIYIVFSTVLTLSLMFFCIAKKRITVINTALLMYIAVEAIAYILIKRYVKVNSKISVKEVVIEDIPLEYAIKGIKLYFYLIYFVPVAISLYFGWHRQYTLTAVGIELVLMLVGIVLNGIIKNYTNFVTEDVEKSMKENKKYRGIWNWVGFVILLIISFTVMILHLDYMSVFELGYFAIFFPAAVFGAIVVTIFAFNIIYNRKS